MKDRFYKLGAIAFVIGLGILVFWNVNHWRLYDELWQPLALTQAENWCSGIAVAKADYDMEAKNEPDCEELSGLDDITPSISNSIPWACQGVASADPEFPVDMCIEQVEAMGLWFIQGGGWTVYWSDARPRPAEVAINSEDPRGTSRGDFGETSTTTTLVEEEE